MFSSVLTRYGEASLTPWDRDFYQAGNYVRDEILSAFIRLVCHTPELQAYTVQKLFSALHADFSQESLTLAAVWVIGEFGEVLIQGGNFQDEELVRDVQPKDVVDLMSSVLDSPYITEHIRQYVLTSMAKLHSRFSHDAAQQSRIEQILATFEQSVEVEIQQRSVEYVNLLRMREIRDGVLESMPPPEIKQTVLGTVSEAKPVGSTRTDKDALLDLMGDEMPATGAASNGGAAPAGKATQQSTHDLLADIFGGSDDMGGGAAVAAAPAAAPAAKPKSSVNDILGLFGDSGMGSAPASAPAPPPGGGSSSGFGGLDLLGGGQDAASAPSPAPAPAPASAPAPAPVAASAPAHVAYDRKGLKVTLTLTSNPARPDITNITARFTATGGSTVRGVNFQAAVPKSQKLQMQAISNPDIEVGKTETQAMRVMAPNGVSIASTWMMMRYGSGGRVTDFSWLLSVAGTGYDSITPACCVQRGRWRTGRAGPGGLVATGLTLESSLKHRTHTGRTGRFGRA